MEPRLSIVTLAVADLERSLRFYRDGLGLPTQGIVGQQWEDGAVVFFKLAAGMILALYPAPSLAKDAAIAPTDRRTGAVSLGHLVASRDAVDAVIGQAQRAGAVITDRPRERFWGGYSGYFQDPDGHLWEIAWNPEWTVPAPSP